MSQIEGHTVDPEVDAQISGLAQDAIINGNLDAVRELARLARRLQVGLQLERERAENDGRAMAMAKMENERLKAASPSHAQSESRER